MDVKKQRVRSCHALPENAPGIFNCETQTMLAAMLSRHFHGRLRGVITPALISNWKLGRRLYGAPLPPPPPIQKGGFWNGQAWVDWMEKHIITQPRFRLGANGHVPSSTQDELDIHDQAIEATARIKLISEKMRQKELDILDGKYVLKEVLGPLVQSIGKNVSAEITSVESVLPKGLEQDLRELSVESDLLRRIVEKFTGRCQEWNDELQASIPKGLAALLKEKNLLPA